MSFHQDTFHQSKRKTYKEKLKISIGDKVDYGYGKGIVTYIRNNANTGQPEQYKVNGKFHNANSVRKIIRDRYSSLKFHQSYEVKAMLDQINQYPPKESLKLFTALNAKDIVYQDRKGDKDAFVQFKVTGDKSPKINKVKVIYDFGLDLYNIEFWYIRGFDHTKWKLVKKINGLYNDQLTETIWRNVVIV